MGKAKPAHQKKFSIDHIGRLPYLLAAGYQGPILCSVPSAKLLPLVIEDALKIGFTRDAALIERFLAEVEGRLQPLEYNRWHSLVDDERHAVLFIGYQAAGTPGREDIQRYGPRGGW